MYIEQWKALSGRIHGLVQVGQLHAQYLVVSSNDTYGRAGRLREHGVGILAELESFRRTFQHSLPPAALDAIKECVDNKIDPLLHDKTGTSDNQREQVWAALVMLAAFETEVTFILSDVQAVIRARSERAFSHLQRLIVVDAATREQWKAALKDREVACEKRGAVHLLLHGIWAFKVGAEGERTDLVYQQPAGGLLDEMRYADGFVLTEWKVASSDEEAQKQFAAARDQAKRYAQGVLAGSELTAFRYAVVVSSRHVTVPNDFVDGGVVYRHINIAADPESPSKARRPKGAK